LISRSGCILPLLKTWKTKLKLKFSRMASLMNKLPRLELKKTQLKRELDLTLRKKRNSESSNLKIKELSISFSTLEYQPKRVLLLENIRDL
jgi:hypothetical protein